MSKDEEDFPIDAIDQQLRACETRAAKALDLLKTEGMCRLDELQRFNSNLTAALTAISKEKPTTSDKRSGPSSRQNSRPSSSASNSVGTDDVVLRVTGRGDKVSVFRLRRRAKFQHLFSTFASTEHVPASQCMFIYKGKALREVDTPEKLGMASSAELEVLTIP